MKRFRFSLMSLLVGVVLAGGVVGLNLWPSPGSTMHLHPFEPSPVWLVDVRRGPAEEFEVCLYGWPFVACMECRPVASSNREYRWPFMGVERNVLIGLAIVFSGAALCERIVRRRASAKVD